MSNINVTNPGDVNVADQGDGRLSVDQPVTTGPGTNPGPLAAGLSSAGVAVDPSLSVVRTSDCPRGAGRVGRVAMADGDAIATEVRAKAQSCQHRGRDSPPG